MAIRPKGTAADSYQLSQVQRDPRIGAPNNQHVSFSISFSSNCSQYLVRIEKGVEQLQSATKDIHQLTSGIVHEIPTDSHRRRSKGPQRQRELPCKLIHIQKNDTKYSNGFLLTTFNPDTSVCLMTGLKERAFGSYKAMTSRIGVMGVMGIPPECCAVKECVCVFLLSNR